MREIKLMSGFGFVEFEDEADARDVVPRKSSHPAYLPTEGIIANINSIRLP